MKKILILYAKYGGGHLSAANALNNYIQENYSNVEAEVVDCVEYVTPLLSKLTTNAYKIMAKYTPNLWKNIYYGSSKGGFWYMLSILTKKYLAHHLLKVYKNFEPDVVVSVHPFGSQVTAYLKEKERINCKLATVFTDFKTQHQWLIGKEFNDYFFVSNNNMKNELLNLDIAENKIFVTGIPLSTKFLIPINHEEVYANLNLNKNLKTILFFGGGEFGLGHEQTIKALHTLTNYLDEYQVIAISGRNKKMKNKFMKIKNEVNSPNLHIYEYSNCVPELMSISSFVITKPGGLTSSESLASNLPLIIINPIPGQEEENAEFLQNSGSAIWIKKSDDIEKILHDFLNDSTRLEEMTNNTKKIAHKYSTRDICEILLKY